MDAIEIRKQVLTQLPNALDAEEMVRLVSRTDESIKPAEFNFHAEPLMFLSVLRGVQPLTKEQEKLVAAMEQTAEQGMLQLAFFNIGIQPPCSVIMRVHAAGWRVGRFGGFEKPATFTLEEPC